MSWNGMPNGIVNGMLNMSMYIVGPIGVHQPYLPSSISSKDMFEISMDTWIWGLRLQCLQVSSIYITVCDLTSRFPSVLSFIYLPRHIGIPLFSQRAQVMTTPAEQKQSYESFWNKGQRFYVWQPWQMYNRFLVVNTLRLWKWSWWLRKWMIWLEFKSVAKVCRDFLGFESGMSCCCWRLCVCGIYVVPACIHVNESLQYDQYVFWLKTIWMYHTGQLGHSVVFSDVFRPVLEFFCGCQILSVVTKSWLLGSFTLQSWCFWESWRPEQPIYNWVKYGIRPGLKGEV